MPSEAVKVEGWALAALRLRDSTKPTSDDQYDGSVSQGLAPESSELQAILQAAKRLPYLEFRGLMTVPPFTEDAEGARPFFRKLRKLRDGIAHARWPNVGMDVLSMGMSHDFEIAVEEGSTCVRVGTALFGDRQKDLTTEDLTTEDTESTEKD